MTNKEQTEYVSILASLAYALDKNIELKLELAEIALTGSRGTDWCIESAKRIDNAYHDCLRLIKPDYIRLMHKYECREGISIPSIPVFDVLLK